MDLIWYYEGYSSSHKFERILPSGEMEIVINLAEDVTRIYHRDDLTRVNTQRGAILMGAHTERFIIDTAETWNTIGVHFKPGCAFAFCCQPAGELQGQHIMLGDLWGATGHTIRERLLEAPTAEQKFRVLESVLLRRARTMQRHPAVEFAVRTLSSRSSSAACLTDVVQQVGYSQRHFNALFQGEVGLSPKKFSRVQRFQQVLERVRRKGTDKNEVNWANVALDCGYYDQAHFIHEFRAFSGMAPSAYMAVKTEHLNHVCVVGDQG